MEESQVSELEPKIQIKTKKFKPRSILKSPATKNFRGLINVKPKKRQNLSSLGDLVDESPIQAGSS